ncbi:hypothetical protein Hypma_001428 [Hypsizygus marmoreus]|uniref:Aminoglycoside phosphotransferase domain-containing protein n=1 Tax=Hypsizygus marmoreus TaxID=39966 RepID=A0A369K2P0_HYPMA|nr:hypothetical protein Hypma_001428 [Hypsizygus marmoreus]
MAEALSDILASLFSSLRNGSRRATFQSPLSEADNWSRREIYRRVDSSSPHPDAVFKEISPNCGHIRILSPDTVVKIITPSTPAMHSEALAQQFVWSHTSIPVPKVRQYIVRNFDAYILMENVKGKRLDRIWSSLSPLQQFLIAWILRSYVLQLRKASAEYARRHVPGPMADTPQKCEGCPWIFGSQRPLGPFESSKDLIECINKRHRSGPAQQLLDSKEPLVLTHGDICARNIILGDDGKVWLVDWERSGFYPPWCEAITMMCAACDNRAPMSWWNAIPLICSGAAWKEKASLAPLVYPPEVKIPYQYFSPRKAA